MPETYTNMTGTFLQYSAMKEYQMAAGVIDPVEYLERYIQTPQIEMLVKLGLIKTVEKHLWIRFCSCKKKRYGFKTPVFER